MTYDMWHELYKISDWEELQSNDLVAGEPSAGLPSQLVPTILSVIFHSWRALAELSASSLGRAMEQFCEVRIIFNIE